MYPALAVVVDDAGQRGDSGPPVAAAVVHQDDRVRLVQASSGAGADQVGGLRAARGPVPGVHRPQGDRQAGGPSGGLGAGHDALRWPEEARPLVGDGGDLRARPSDLDPISSRVPAPATTRRGMRPAVVLHGVAGGVAAAGPGRVQPPPRDRRRRTLPSRSPAPARRGHRRSIHQGRRRTSARPCADHPHAARSAAHHRRGRARSRRRARRPGHRTRRADGISCRGPADDRVPDEDDQDDDGREQHAHPVPADADATAHFDPRRNAGVSSARDA